MLFETSDIIAVCSLLVGYATYRQGKNKAKNEEISKILEDVYFSSDGVISLVEAYANGKNPSEAAKVAVLNEFNDWETHSNSLRKLLEADEFFKGKLTISQRKALTVIGYNKVQVRQAVQALIGNGFQKLSSVEAKIILKNILALNSSIEEAQDLLCS